MKWEATPKGFACTARTEDDAVVIHFDIEKGRGFWRAHMVPEGTLGIRLGDYKTDRIAKAVCRRKLGRLVDSLKRIIQA